VRIWNNAPFRVVCVGSLGLWIGLDLLSARILPSNAPAGELFQVLASVAAVLFAVAFGSALLLDVLNHSGAGERLAAGAGAGNAAAHAGSVDVLTLIEAIGEDVEQATAALPPGYGEAHYTLNEVRARYLPDTLTAYVHAASADPPAAASMALEQLGIIRDYVTRQNDALAQGRLQELDTNGRFLRARFATSKKPQ